MYFGDRQHHSNVSQYCYKKVITMLLRTMALPNHLDGVGGLQRMVGRGRGSPSSLISLSYLPLTTLGTVPIPWKLQPFMEAAECCGGLQSLLLPLLGKKTPAQPPTLPSGHTQAYTCCTRSILLCPSVFWGAKSTIFCRKTGGCTALLKICASQKLWKRHARRKTGTDELTGLTAVSMTAVTLNTC